MIKIFRHEFDAPIGRMTLLSTDEGLCFIGFSGCGDKYIDHFIKKNFGQVIRENGGMHNALAAKEITRYLTGELRRFSIRIDLRVSDFNREVLSIVQAIPYGKIRTYGDIAAQLGKPGASRAVGTANARNPLPLIVPCHRVVASNGLGGYGGGLDLKRKLLQMEGVLPEQKSLA